MNISSNQGVVTYSNLKKKTEGYLKELKALLLRCEEKGIETPYETAKYEIISKFLSYAAICDNYDEFHHLAEFDRVFSREYIVAKTALESYISGEKKPFAVPRFLLDGQISLDGTSVIGKTQVDGKIEERPVFFVGYGNWMTAMEEIPFFSKLGYSAAQVEVKMWNLFQPLEQGEEEEYVFADIPSLLPYEKEAHQLGIRIDEERLCWLRRMLEQANEYNYVVDFLLAPHYMPDFIKNRDPEITSNRLQFMPFVVDHELVRKVASLWVRMLATIVKEYPCVQSICLMNEPSLRSRNGQHYVPLWQEYLKRMHGSIEALNEAYGTKYRSFEEVMMPSDPEKLNPDKEATPVGYEYCCFNDSLMTEFHQFLADEVRKVYPNILVNTKAMDYVKYNGGLLYYNGVNYEQLAGMMDVNGCDAFSYYDSDETPLYSKMGWYDFMTSLKNVPVWDTESHISTDLAVAEYDELIEYYTGADVWNGAVHGRGMDVIWLWELRGDTMPWGLKKFANANGAVRPADVIEVSRAALDLNRLSKEITAIQKKERKVGILYSRTSVNYVEDIMERVIPAYKEAICSGQKVGFITDTTLEDMHQYQLVIVPQVPNVPETVIHALKAYIEHGGQVIILDNESLRRNEYNQSYHLPEMEYIYNHSSVGESVSARIEQMELSELVLKDAKTGAKLTDVEWSYAEYDGKIVVNMVNYDRKDSVTVKVIYQGKEIEKFTELRYMEQHQQQITLKPYQPLLIAF